MDVGDALRHTSDFRRPRGREDVVAPKFYRLLPPASSACGIMRGTS